MQNYSYSKFIYKTLFRRRFFMLKKIVSVCVLLLVLLAFWGCAQNDPVVYDDFDDNRNVSAYFVGGDDGDGALITEDVANPLASDLNNSANVGQFDKTEGADKVFGGDVGAKNKNKPYGHLLIYSDLESAFKLSLQDAEGNELASAEATYSQIGEWEDLIFDFSEADLSGSIEKFVIVVFAEDAGTIYFDEFQFARE